MKILNRIQQRRQQAQRDVFYCLAATWAFFCMFSISCDDEALETIYVAPAPEVLNTYEETVVGLELSRPFIFNPKHAPRTSEGGLQLTEIRSVGETRAEAVFVTTAETQSGSHMFDFTDNGKVAFFEIWVAETKYDHHKVEVKLAEATAGARLGEITITGHGTHFDSSTTVEVADAPGMKIRGTELTNGQSINVFFDIDMLQPPAVATIEITDGDSQYTLPFRILEPKRYPDVDSTAFLVKGQTDAIHIKRAWTDLHKGSIPVNLPAGVQFGNIVSAGENICMRVRVPYDYAEDELSFDMYTWSNGGNTLEIISRTVDVKSPAYVAVVPSVIHTDSEVDIALYTDGIAADQINSFTLDESTDGVSLLRPFNTDETASVTVSGDAATGINLLKSISTKITLEAQFFVVNDHTRNAAYPLVENVYEGDRILVPVTLTSNDVDTNDVYVAGTPYVEVHEITPVDSGTIILDIQVSDHGYSQSDSIREELTVHTPSGDYPVPIKILENQMRSL